MLLDCLRFGGSRKHNEKHNSEREEQQRYYEGHSSNSSSATSSQTSVKQQRKSLRRTNTVQPAASLAPINDEKPNRSLSYTPEIMRSSSSKSPRHSEQPQQHCDNNNNNNRIHDNVYTNDGNTYDGGDETFEDTHNTSKRLSIETCIMGDNLRNMLNGTPVPTPILFFSNGSPKDVKGWSESLDNLLKDPVGLQTFFMHLKGEHSTENIRFWLACENYKNRAGRDDEATRYDTAHQIFKEFLSRCATSQINVPCRLFRELKQELGKPNANTYLALQHEIYNLMRTDSYPRFLRSDKYLEMLKDSKS